MGHKESNQTKNLSQKAEHNLSAAEKFSQFRMCAQPFDKGILGWFRAGSCNEIQLVHVRLSAELFLVCPHIYRIVLSHAM